MKPLVVDEADADEVVSRRRLSELDGEINDLATALTPAQDGMGWSALIRANFLFSNDEVGTGTLFSPDDADLAGFAFADIDLAFWGSVGIFGWRINTDIEPNEGSLLGTGGYNIDPNQIENAIDWARECKMSDRLHFKVGDHHAPLEYEDATFDGCFSFQAVWPFFKKDELDEHAREMYRVLKPGARYACSEYLLSPYFDWSNEEHVALHKTYLPTLAATQSMYPADVCSALERAGFEILVSAPSKSEAWPLCEQKRDLILMGRRVVRALEAIRVLPPWVEESLDLLQTGGQAWTDAEKAKIADLNWRIVAEKR